jgi:diguanylate cyclase (GGDEF)-like protein
MSESLAFGALHSWLGVGIGSVSLLLAAALAVALLKWARRVQCQAREAADARESLQSEIAELTRAEEELRARSDRHLALASIGERALLASDLSRLFEQVAGHVGAALAADACSIWTVSDDGTLELRAVYTSVFERSVTEADAQRLAHYTYWVNQPVASNHLASDPRLRGGPTDAALASGAAVPFSLQRAPYGVLSVHSRAKRAFTADLSFLESVGALLTAAAERKHSEDALQRRALHDPLTGLANRSLFQDRLSLALHAAKRDKKPLALMLMDLDRFKEVNDTLGHQAGDELLLEVGRRLRHAKRATDTVARLGGDEFALILPAVVDLRAATRLATEVLAGVEGPMALQDQTVDIGASIGLAVYPEHGDDVDELLRCADIAMYAAKRGGSGVAVYANGLDQHSRSRLAMASALRLAIEAGQLALYYQPQIDLRSSEVAGFEALLRWNHPELGLLAPDTFIPLAEEMGLSPSLDRWALNAALEQAHAWQTEAGLEIPISVNLSMRNVLDQNLSQIIGDLLAKWKVNPQQLELEITESSIMADPLKVRAVLAQCRALGVHMAIDDFGTGYSSLAYLKRLPVDCLKIDKSFVSDMAADKSDLAIVRSTIELGHNLGLRVIAEGVEDEITARLLSQLRCDVAQGHHLSRPLASTDVLPWLDHSRWPHPAEQYAA